MIRKIVKILGFVLLVYFFASVGFYLFQDNIIFQSAVLPKDYVFKFDQKFEEHFIVTHDGETLNGILFKAAQPTKGLILYFHGNAGNMQRWGNYAIDFSKLGYDVLMIDYRGFGKSTGTPSENNLYADAQTLLQWAQINIPYTRIIFYGRSLGSAVASNLADQVEPDLLMLETPFDELKGVVYRPLRPMLYFFSPRYQFSNLEHLKNVTCKTVIIHGTDDWVVPLSSAIKLKPLLKGGDKFVIIDGGGHKNLRHFEMYHNTLEDALK